MTAAARGPAARSGCVPFLFPSCFALLWIASPAAPIGMGARPFPVFILWLAGKRRALGCVRCPVFFCYLQVFTGAAVLLARRALVQECLERRHRGLVGREILRDLLVEMRRAD